MDADQFEKLYNALNRMAAATLATSVVASMTRKATLKEIQSAFTDCLMIVNPADGTEKQDDFQKRLDKKEW
jgi:hypothetical protein